MALLAALRAPARDPHIAPIAQDAPGECPARTVVLGAGFRQDPQTTTHRCAARPAGLRPPPGTARRRHCTRRWHAPRRMLVCRHLSARQSRPSDQAAAAPPHRMERPPAMHPGHSAQPMHELTDRQAELHTLDAVAKVLFTRRAPDAERDRAAARRRVRRARAKIVLRAPVTIRLLRLVAVAVRKPGAAPQPLQRPAVRREHPRLDTGPLLENHRRAELEAPCGIAERPGDAIAEASHVAPPAPARSPAQVSARRLRTGPQPAQPG